MSHTTSAIHPALRASRGMSEPTRQILDQRLYAVLATENDDGSVHLAPVMFLYADERILIETAATTRKARNVAARPTASVLIQTPDAAWTLGTGPATIVQGTDAAHLNERIRAKYLTPEGQHACGELLAELDDITIAVAPTRWLSWNIGPLMETLAGRGVDVDQAESWFRADE